MRPGALLVVSFLVGAARLAEGQPTDAQREAGEFFERGEAARNQGKYREAIAAYERAYALAPHPFALYNIALSYEKLEDWAHAADYYERYLAADRAAVDADEVRDKIRDFRGRTRAAATPAPLPDEPTGVGVQQTSLAPVVPAPQRWHVGVSYGLGFGDAPTERFNAHAGIKLAGRLELDGVLGKFGKNDLAVGAMARFLVARTEYTQPFLHGAATLGYAKQDDSSDASTKVPLGLEAGAGVRLGGQLHVELAAVFRFVRGGFDETSTVVDSYVNDSFAFGIDLGLALDVPPRLPAGFGQRR